MTRINIVPPEELTDQHLFAEFREIKMVPKALARSLKTKSASQVLSSIPGQFTLNAGHVKFFYDKGAYLSNRYQLILKELELRGINYNRDSLFDEQMVMSSHPWNNNWEPDATAYSIIRERISSKIQLRPDWYRLRGKKLNPP